MVELELWGDRPESQECTRGVLVGLKTSDWLQSHKVITIITTVVDREQVIGYKAINLSQFYCKGGGSWRADLERSVQSRLGSCFEASVTPLALGALGSITGLAPWSIHPQLENRGQLTYGPSIQAITFFIFFTLFYMVTLSLSLISTLLIKMVREKGYEDIWLHFLNVTHFLPRCCNPSESCLLSKNEK